MRYACESAKLFACFVFVQGIYSVIKGCRAWTDIQSSLHSLGECFSILETLVFISRQSFQLWNCPLYIIGQLALIPLSTFVVAVLLCLFRPRTYASGKIFLQNF